MGMPNRNRKLLALRVLPVLIAAAYTSGAVAQEKIEEVVVTAQKRKEKLQDVPISISAIGGAQLETRGIEGAKDLNSLAPRTPSGQVRTCPDFFYVPAERRGRYPEECPCPSTRA